MDRRGEGSTILRVGGNRCAYPAVPTAKDKART